MQRRLIRFQVLFLVMVFLVGCASETPWRKITVETYELVGAGFGVTKDTSESLKAQNLITDAQLAKIKEIYGKARASYVAAGNALKVAGRAVAASQRDNKLAEYSKLMADFAVLAGQVYDLIKGFKKVSLNDVIKDIQAGGELCLLQP
jgi:hypothetical protein